MTSYDFHALVASMTRVQTAGEQLRSGEWKVSGLLCPETQAMLAHATKAVDALTTRMTQHVLHEIQNR